MIPISHILPQLAANLTKVPRQIMTPGLDFQWSSKLWTHNIFRVWELLFGRRDGIRRATRTWTWIENGRQFVQIETFTVEDTIAQIEAMVRNFITIPAFEFVPIRQLAVTGEAKILLPIFSFAIALDANSDASNASTTSLTWSHTTTGSNTIMFTNVQDTAGDTVTSETYNSVAITLVNKLARVGGRFHYLHNLVAPTTGTNTVAVNVSGATQVKGHAITYTGAAQTGQPDSQNTTTWTASASPVSSPTTVVASNCWLIAFADLTAGTDFTLVSGNTYTDAQGDTNFFDSGGTVGTGSQSLSWTSGVAVTGISGIASFAPSGGAVRRPQPNLLMLGVA